MSNATQEAIHKAKDLADTAVLLADGSGNDPRAMANAMAAIAYGLAAVAAAISERNNPMSSDTGAGTES